MIDLKTMGAVLGEFEDRGITRATMVEAIESAMATAYKREYGKRGQVVRAKLDLNTGTITFEQVKTVVDETTVRFPTPDEEITSEHSHHHSYHGEEEHLAEGELPRFDSEKHILLTDAKLMKRGAVVGEEIIFPLEPQDDFGRIAAQTAKQVIIQRIREAEKISVLEEYGKKEGDIVTGSVQRIERGTIFVDLGKATGIIPYEEQIPGERYRQGERIRAYLYSVEESPRGVHLRLSRAHPDFIEKLFAIEAPEIANGTVMIKAVAREPGSRSKIAVYSSDEHIDPVGSCVGQRGVRVSTVMSELGGEKIDIIEWSEDQEKFIEEALSPARISGIEIKEDEKTARVDVAEDQLSLAIGKGGQNVRLAAKLTGWRIDIKGIEGENTDENDGNTEDVARDIKVKDEKPVEETPLEPTDQVDPASNGAGETTKSDTEKKEEVTDEKEKK